MLNLTQLEKESSNYSFIEKILDKIKPDTYLAENLADYKENVSSLKSSEYKIFPFLNKFIDKAYIHFFNVGLKKLNYKGIEIPSWFLLYDSSGKEAVYWNVERGLFPTIDSFEKLQREEGFRQSDLIYDVSIKYFIRSKLSSIVEINRSKLTNRLNEGLLEKNFMFSF